MWCSGEGDERDDDVSGRPGSVSRVVSIAIKNTEKGVIKVINNVDGEWRNTLSVVVDV